MRASFEVKAAPVVTLELEFDELERIVNLADAGYAMARLGRGAEDDMATMSMLHGIWTTARRKALDTQKTQRYLA